MQRRLDDHKRSMRSTFERVVKTKWATAMTVLALGIGLAIPALLYSLSDTFSNWLNQWDGRPQMSLYLEQTVTPQASQLLLDQTKALDLVVEVEFVSAEQGLAEFRQLTEFDSALNLLKTNPLPAVIVAYLRTMPEERDIARLSDEFKAMPGVSAVQYDLEWLQRLAAINRFILRSIALLASLMVAGVILLISNTIRLEITHRADEISIIDQLGATKAFIRRPFLYYGALQGFLGGVVGLLITLIGRLLLQGPLSSMTSLYADVSQVSGVSPLLVFVILVGSTVLGWVSARITVWRHLFLLKPA